MEKGRGARRMLSGLVGVLVCAAGGSAWADLGSGQYLNGSTRKLGRGLANVVSAPLELLREPTLVTQREGGLAGVTIGIIRGVVATVFREAAGIAEVVTFPIPIPKDFEPIVKPEFVYANGDWSP